MDSWDLKKEDLWGVKSEDIFQIKMAYDLGLGEMNLKKVNIAKLKA